MTDKERDFRNYCVEEDIGDKVVEILALGKREKFIFIHIDYTEAPPNVIERRPEVNSEFELDWIKTNDKLTAKDAQYVYAWGDFVSGMDHTGFSLYFPISLIIATWQDKEDLLMQWS